MLFVDVVIAAVVVVVIRVVIMASFRPCRHYDNIRGTSGSSSASSSNGGSALNHYLL